MTRVARARPHHGPASRATFACKLEKGARPRCRSREMAGTSRRAMTTTETSQAESANGPIRSHRHRRRPRRLCLRDPRGATRHEGRRRREAQDARRDVPQHRLHTLQGAAVRLGNVRGGRARLGAARRRRRRAQARPRRDDEAQGRDRRRQRQRRGVPVQEEQDRLGGRRGPHRRARQGRRQGRRRQGDDARSQGESSSPPARTSRACPASRSTKRPSSPPPARSRSPSRRKSSSSSAPASSAWNSARCGGGSAPR